MKQIILITSFFIAFGFSCFSQSDSLKQRVINSMSKKNLQLETNSPFIKKTNSAPPQQTSSPAPDLIITALNVRYVSSQIVNGQTKNNIEISCTIKNIGTASIAAKDVGLDGQISFSPSYTYGIAACGTALSTIVSDVINPGSSFSVVYNCSVAYDKNQKAYYNIAVSTSPNIVELNKQNNTAQMTILNQ